MVYSSRLRPIVLNFAPKNIIWSFNADTHVTDWLEAMGHDHDVVTDEDIHDEGLEALAGYSVIVTGTHPEYWSTPMWDALTAYFGQGGRMMYLGGNGFLLAHRLSSRTAGRGDRNPARREWSALLGRRGRASIITASPANTAACGNVSVGRRKAWSASVRLPRASIHAAGMCASPAPTTRVQAGSWKASTTR